MSNMRIKSIALGLASAILVSIIAMPEASAQRGRGGGGGGAKMAGRGGFGGGARPSIGSVGGGGARPASRPSMPSSRPNISRPNVSNQSHSRPTLGNANTRPASRPSLPSLGNGSIGSNRPSLGGAGNLPNLSRPANLPSIPSLGNRPSLGSGEISTRPGAGERPSFGNLSRPTTLPGNVSKPGNISKPGLGSDRPSLGNNRPTTLPGTVNRPGVGVNRPVTLPGNVDRPNLGLNRPGGGSDRPIIGGNRPGGSDRPNIGNIINRPSIGGNRPNIGGNWLGSGNINIGNDINIGNQVGNHFPNRPNWDIDPGFSRPSWGLNGNDWHNNWHNNCVNNHHHWYNGCWHGYWGSSWYAPVAWAAAGWGLNSITSGWGYYSSYYNPYYAVPVVAQAVPYDYSQPVVINNIVSSESAGGDAQASQSSTAEQAGLTAFDSGLAKFKLGRYRESLADFDVALKQLPNDAVVHEARCLALFAVADYAGAAAGLNSLLSAAPGMDWTTMSGLYGDATDYTTQLRALEKFCDSKPTDAPAHFVLAYHYLVMDSKDAAIDALKVVVKNQPKDMTAKRMLDALVPPVPAASPAAAESPTEVAATNELQTDLVGAWVAQARDTKIELTVDEESKFVWKATGKNQAPVELSGMLTSFDDGIELTTTEQGTVAGIVKSNGPSGWNFSITGSPPSDPGLSFTRVK